MLELNRHIRSMRLIRSGGFAALLLGLVGVFWLANHLLPISAEPPRPPPTPTDQPVLHSGKVIQVVDGDSLVLEGGGRVRLAGIDAPESGARGYEEAGRALTEMVLGKEICLAYGPGDQRDRYGRMLAFLTDPDGLEVNQALLERGLVWIYKLGKRAPRRSRFLAAQQLALAERRGSWVNLAAGGHRYLGSRSSFTFHREDCAFGRKISQRNRVEFSDLASAFAEGYAPCRQCIHNPYEGR